MVSAIQVWNADDPEDEVLAMVVRTGLNTCMGSMVRQMIAPTRLQKEATPFVAVTCAAMHLCSSF